MKKYPNKMLKPKSVNCGCGLEDCPLVPGHARKQPRISTKSSRKIIRNTIK